MASATRTKSAAKNAEKAAGNKKSAVRKTANARQRAHKKRLAESSKTMKLVWRHATCRVRHTRNYISTSWSHIEIEVLTPKGAPLPITETGYKSHFLDEDILQAAGGPVAFFTA